jgi:4-hydroxy-tetrahydrodipicolinate synthase
MGATGWIAGFVNAFPAQSVRLFDACVRGAWNEALPLYRAMLPALRWDADPLFVQAIKIGQEEAGRYGGPVRLPRLPLSEADEARARKDARAALSAASTGASQ